MFTTFQFVLTFVVTMNAMAIIKPISIKLQRSIDIVSAYHKVDDVATELLSARTSDCILHQWYSQAESLAAEVNVVPAAPRTVGRQRHRENVEHRNVESITDEL